jgi:hypothetical protein
MNVIFNQQGANKTFYSTYNTYNKEPKKKPLLQVVTGQQQSTAATHERYSKFNFVKQPSIQKP